MIKTNSIENLTGSAKTNVSQILVWDAENGVTRLPNGDIVQINGSGGNGGNGGDTVTDITVSNPGDPVAGLVIGKAYKIQYVGNYTQLFDEEESGYRSGIAINTDKLIFKDHGDNTFYDFNTGGFDYALYGSPKPVLGAYVHFMGRNYGASSSTSVQDDQISVPGANIAAGGNQYRIQQDNGQPDWNKFQVKVIQLPYSNVAAGGSFAVKQIKVEATDSNYHPLKILMYDQSGSLIKYTQNNPSDTSDLTAKNEDSTNLITPSNITGIFSPTNSSYHITRTFDTNYLPNSNGGWHSVVKVASSSRTTAVTFTFDSPQDVAEIHLMRNYSVGTFGNNTGTSYITLINESGVEHEIEMPPPVDFSSPSDFVKDQPASGGGETVNLDETFGISYSTNDGISFDPLTELGKNSAVDGTNVTTTSTFEAEDISPSAYVILKVQDDQVSKVDRVLMDAWYLQ